MPTFVSSFHDKHDNKIAEVTCFPERKEVCFHSREDAADFYGKDVEAYIWLDIEHIKDLVDTLQHFLIQAEGKAYDYKENM